jgi:hypothetical protein
MQVNKQEIFGRTHREAAALILNSTSPITMVFHRPHDPNWSEKASMGCHQPDGGKRVQREESWSDLTLASESVAEPTLKSITEENSTIAEDKF